MILLDQGQAMRFNSGIAAATSSFVMWGLLPIYWKMLGSVPAYEILCHRMAWSLVVTACLLAVLGKTGGFGHLIKEKKQFLYFLLTAIILSVNWLIYIWAVNSGHIIEASLGYFINPLVSVCFGVVFLKERIRPWQWFSVVLAFAGVSYLTWNYGEFPWIAVSLACTFACYGLLHKITTVPALEGLCLETSMLFLPALGVILFWEGSGTGAFLAGSPAQTLLLAGTGLVTTAPLLCFCYAAQKIPLYLVGLLQYLAPTINLLVGIFLYGEAFPKERMIGFAIIWCALALLIGDGLSRQMRAWRTSVKLRG
ncbi:MAG: EamA family transporter RarD [Desulfopila sp.]|nr:EamA family transporter RarD [Desulfopila sp.]